MDGMEIQPLQLHVLRALQEKLEWKPALLAIRVVSMEEQRTDESLTLEWLQDTQRELERNRLPALKQAGLISYTPGETVSLDADSSSVEDVLARVRDVSGDESRELGVGFAGAISILTKAKTAVRTLLDDAARYADELVPSGGDDAAVYLEDVSPTRTKHSGTYSTCTRCVRVSSESPALPDAGLTVRLLPPLGCRASTR